MSISEHSTPESGVASKRDKPDVADAGITVMSESGKRVVKIPVRTGFLLGIILTLFLVIALQIVLG